MSERDFGPATSLMKRRLWGVVGFGMVLGLVIGMVALFGSSTARGQEAPPSPWLFVMVSALVVSILLIGHRWGKRKDR